MTNDVRADGDDDSPLRVLLVEDDESVALVLMRAIAVEAAELLSIQRVKDLATAIARLKNAAFDWVFLDPGLPDAPDGAQVINAVCDAAAGALVVLITGGLKDAAAEQAAKRALGVVLKPLPPRSLLMHSLIEEPLMELELRPDAMRLATDACHRAHHAVQAWRLGQTDAGLK